MTGTPWISAFALRRHIDGRVYRFMRHPHASGLPAFQRTDGPHWIVRRRALGWIAWDFETEAIMGRPWDVLPEDQPAPQPPQGIWVSRKGDKSYVYTLTYTAAPT